MAGRANPLMEGNVVGAALSGVVAVVNSPTTAECGAAWCGVVQCSCSRNCSCNVVVDVAFVAVV